MKGIIHSKVRGVTMEGRQEVIRRMVRPGMKLQAIREPKNPHDKNAIGLWAGREQIGYLSSDLAEELAPRMDAGQPIDMTVTEMTGNGPGESVGVNIVIDTQGASSAPVPLLRSRSALRAVLTVLGLLVVSLVCAAAQNAVVGLVCAVLAGWLVWQWSRTGVRRA